MPTLAQYAMPLLCMNWVAECTKDVLYMIWRWHSGMHLIFIALLCNQTLRCKCCYIWSYCIPDFMVGLWCNYMAITDLVTHRIVLALHRTCHEHRILPTVWMAEKVGLLASSLPWKFYPLSFRVKIRILGKTHILLQKVVNHVSFNLYCLAEEHRLILKRYIITPRRKKTICQCQV